MSARRSVKRKKISEDVVEMLVKDIRTGIYQPNTELPSERDLMEEFGVGRPAIREALTRLELMGLIDIKPGARARVRMPTVSRLMEEMSGAVGILLSTEEGMKQLQDVRIFFEAGLARNAARRATDEDVRRLEDALAENAGHTGKLDYFAQSDLLFHRILAEISGNPILLSVEQVLSGWLLEQRLLSLQTEKQAETALLAHRKIFDAVKNHDAEAAERAVVEHISQVNQVLRKKTSS